MTWLNPRTWFARKEDSTLTLDQYIQRSLERIDAAGQVVVTPDTALQSPTMFAIVNGMSRVLAQLPVDIIRRTDKGRQGQDDHPLAYLLNTEPAPWLTAYEFWFSTGVRALLHGEALAYIGQAPNGRIVGLQPMLPGSYQYDLGANNRVAYTWNPGNGSTRTLTQRQVFHVRFATEDGLNCISPLSKIRNSIALEIAAERFGGHLFSSNAIPSVVLKHPGHFKNQTAADRFRDSWNNAFRGKRGTAVLEDGMDITPVQLSNEESQFLETRKFQRTVIAGAYGVPPHRIGDLERATFSNIEHQALEFVTYALTPLLVAIEQAAARDLLPVGERGQVQVKFNVDALLRGDAKSRAETLKIEREAGVLSANEWRRILDRPPRTDPGGDEYITPLNMRQGQEEPGPGNDKKPPPPTTPPPEGEQE